MRRGALISFICLLLVLNVWGNNIDTVYQNALEAYNHNNYSETIKFLKQYLNQVDSKNHLLPEAIFLLAVIVYFWFMTIAALSIMRYIVPVMPFVIIFSAFAVNILIEKIFPKLKSFYDR